MAEVISHALTLSRHGPLLGGVGNLGGFSQQLSH